MTRRRRDHTALVLLACCVGGLGLSGPARAARFALLVGNNDGHTDEVRLRFSESDMVRLAETLTRLGGFGAGATTLLLARSADEVRRALIDLGERLRATPGEHLVLVYYSGHADAQALHLGPSALPLVELREALTALPAATRLLILDACQAGVLTRAKGGSPGPGFEIELAAGEPTRGLAILASSAGSELAQESDQLGASVFTHYLQVGLAGLADRNRDGAVSLGEVFDYTSDRTLAATLGTSTGPQHPTFHLDLSGHDDLILTRPGAPGAGYGHLRLDVPGWYFVRRRDGTIAAEVVSRGDESLALAPGPYEVTRRKRHNLDVALVSVAEGGAATISDAPARTVAFGRMVRKGEAPGSAAYELIAATSLRTPLESLGASVGAVVAARVDLSALSVEARLALGRAHQDSEHLSSTTWDLSPAVAVLRLRDLGSSASSALTARLTWGLGLQAGASYLSQVLDDGEHHSSWNPFFGPAALLEVALWRRYFLRAEIDGRAYAVRVQDGTGGTRTAWRPALASALGAGASF